MIALAGTTRISVKQVQTSIRMGAFTLVLLSAIGLLLTQSLFLSSMILMAATGLAWSVGKKVSHQRFWELASLLYLGFFLFDVFSLSRGLAQALVHLFVFILINKLFNLRNTRDYYQVYLLTFLCMLAASSLSVEIEIFYLVLVYVVLFLWNMASMTLLREWQKQESETTFPFSLFHPFFWLAVVAGAMVAFTVAMGIFFILPRIQMGYFSNLKSQKLQHVSGFSQSVNLGDISSIGDNTGVAMRVRVSSAEPLQEHRFYWRGMGFDHYDGKSWSTSIQGTRFLSDDSFSNFYSTNYTGDPSSLIKQEFYLEPIDTRVIFGQDRIVRVNGAFRAVTRDANHTLMGMTRLEHYEVYSRINEFNPEHFDSLEPTPGNIRDYYLQVPSLSSEFHTLVSTLATANPGTLERILAVKTYLEDNYLYSTEDLPRDEIDPISEFLFRKKTGACEYFATSMVLLLRDMGIPARLVSGYLQGEYNEIGNFYLVRQTDAHAWTEVYLNGQWYPVDPSPRRLDGAGGSLLDFSKVVESITFFWDRYILIFSAEDQLNALTTARDHYKEIAKDLKSRGESLPSTFVKTMNRMWKEHRLPILIVLVLLVMLAVGIHFHLRRARLRKLLRSPVLFYQRMLLLLQTKGYAKPPESTPSEFVESIKQEIPDPYMQDLSFLTSLFYRSRFGNHLLTEAEMAAVRESLTRLKGL